MPRPGYETRAGEGVPVVSAPAEIDITNLDELLQAVQSYTDTGHTVLVVDMSETTFCDSATVNQLLQRHKRLAVTGGGLRLVVGAAPVMQLLAIIGADRMVPIFASLEEAAAEARTGTGPTRRDRR